MIHALFPTTRPAPILFPTGTNARNRMAEERHDAFKVAERFANVIPAHIIAHQRGWIARLDARIAQVVS